MGDLKNILNSFKVQESLNPKIWEKSEGDFVMVSKVRNRLLEIANDFIEFLNVDIVISDIIMTGSLANYNWSKYSDVDIHIIVDFNQFSDNEKPLYEELFFLKKSLYNDKNDIKIFGYDVENYVEDESIQKEVKGIGKYSLLLNEWVSKPNKQNVNINYKQISSKVKQWMKIIDGVIDNTEDEDIETSKNIINKYNDKLRKYRECGLRDGGEYSEENLVFKVLRRNGYLDKFRNLTTKLTNKKLSMNESLIRNKSKVGNFLVISDNTSKGHGGRRLGNWESDNAWDLKAPIGTSVHSFTNGVVSKVHQSAPGQSKIFGTQVSIKGTNGSPNIFYTHLDSVKLKSGDKVKIGDFIGNITRWPAVPEGSHVHVGLPYGIELDAVLSGNKVDFSKFKKEKYVKSDNDSIPLEKEPIEKKSNDSNINKIINNLKPRDKVYDIDPEDYIVASDSTSLLDKFLDLAKK